MQNPTHRHHYVPECYLKKFVDTNGKVYTLNITQLKKGWNVIIRDKTPSQICYKENYYLVRPAAVVDALTLQVPHALYIEHDVFHQFENNFETLYQEVIQNQQLSIDAANNLCRFLVHIKLRNPYHLTHTIKKKKSELLKQAIEEAVKPKEGSDRIQKMSSHVKELAKELVFNKYNSNPDTPNNIFQSSLASRYKDPNGYKVFQDAMLKGTWSLLQAPANGPKFLTSDNPGVALGPDKLFYNTRLHNGFMFIFPLSKDYCLTIDDNISDILAADATYKNVQHVATSEQHMYKINDYLIQLHNEILISSEESYLQQLLKINKPKGK